MIKKINMDNLICSSCVGKIEKELVSLKYVNNATFNFTNQTMLIDVTDDYNENEAILSIKKIVDSIENGVETYLPSKKNTHSKDKRTYINAFTIGLVFFLLAMILQNVISEMYVITLYWFGYILTANQIIIKTLKGLKRKDYFNENTLMIIATITAMILTFYLEAVLVVLFYTFGEYLQHKAVSKSKGEIKGLIDLKVDYANVEVDGNIMIKTPEEIKLGDIILVKNGDKIPIDGVVVSGQTSLNTSALTGETKLSFVEEGNEILSGNLNVGSVIRMEATKKYSDSTVYKIIDLIENSTNLKAKPEAFITKFAKFYTPIVTILAFIMFAIPSLMDPSNMSVYVYRAAVFLVISCPCALVLSVPLSYFSGIGAAARNGILFKGSSFLHMLTDVDTIGLDKTGTITKGNFKVTDFSDNETLKLAASIESFSNHPIATSIIDSYEGDMYTIENIEEIPGQGLVGFLMNEKVYVGNEKLLLNNKIDIPKIDKSSTSVLVAKNNKFIGQIIINDEIRKESIEAIKSLSAFNITMLTGDNEETSKKIAYDVGNINYYSGLLPENKIEVFNNLPSNKLKMFVGDGINDAPLLKNADIGVAMGNGSELAIDVADIIIMDDDLNKLKKAIMIANKTKRIVIQNITLTLGLKLFIVILAGFGLSSMLAAIFADVGVSLIAVLNSLRIIYSKDLNNKDKNINSQKVLNLFKLCSDIYVYSILETLSDNEYTLEDLANHLKSSTKELLSKINSLIEEKIVMERKINGNITYTLQDRHIKKFIKIAKIHAYN